MFRRELNLGEVFLDSAGRKLRQFIIESNRNEPGSLSKICMLSQGRLYDYPDYSAQRFEQLNVEDKSKRAVQIILHAWQLSRNPRQRGELSATWAEIENDLRPFISDIQEMYRDTSAKAITDQLKYFAETAFKRAHTGCLAAFRVPLQGQLDFRVVEGAVAENGQVITVNISCVRQQGFFERMLSCP